MIPEFGICITMKDILKVFLEMEYKVILIDMNQDLYIVGWDLLTIISRTCTLMKV